MSSIVFVDSPKKATPSGLTTFRRSFFVSPADVAFRVWASFVPPLAKDYRVVHVDLLGPSLALLLLAAILNYGYSFKPVGTFGPNEFLSLYCLLVPGSFLILCRYVGRSAISLSEMTTLLGYALYGHVTTLGASYAFFRAESDWWFFAFLALFGGASTLRLVMVVMRTVPVPGARLLVCSLMAIAQVLSLIFAHFAFMHRTYRYRAMQAAEGEAQDGFL